MAYYINYTISNKQKFPGMGGLPSIPDIVDTNYLDSVYGNVDYTYRLNLSVIDDDSMSYTITDIELQNVSDPLDYTVNLTNKYVLISRNEEASFDLDTYRFVKITDSNQIEITEDDTEENIFIYEWIPPSDMIVEYSFKVKVKFNDTGVEKSASVVLKQKNYWHYIPSLEKFEDYVSDG